MANFVRGSTIAGAFGLLGASYFGYSVAYPYTREVYMTTIQRNEADAFTIQKIENAFKKLQEHPECKSLLKKHLTADVKDQLKYKKTRLGASLFDVISSGVENLDSGIGIYAADAESYKVFAPLFDAIIQDYHNFSAKDNQPDVNLGEDHVSEFEPLDTEGKYVKSTRISCNRTLKGYPFTTLLTQDDYLIMQEKIKKALENFTDEDLKGTYHPLDNLKEDLQRRLSTENKIKTTNGSNYWPKGRGVFHNDKKSLLIWVNDEDHVRIVSEEQGSNVGEVFNRLIRGIKKIESKVPFARDDHLGWLTYNPANLGSGVRASVLIRLPKLSARKDFNEICERLNLQVKNAEGDQKNLLDVSNKATLGLSEYQAVKQMYDGVKELIRLEKEQK